MAADALTRRRQLLNDPGQVVDDALEGFVLAHVAMGVTDPGAMAVALFLEAGPPATGDGHR